MELINIVETNIIPNGPRPRNLQKKILIFILIFLQWMMLILFQPQTLK
jgi:hypothetical protein